MLVLVLIFIITAPLLANSIRLDLPHSDAAWPNEVPTFVMVVLDKTGRIFLDDKPSTPAQLALRFTEAARQNP
jgi:biopolymer transport protein ExbD